MCLSIPCKVISIKGEMAVVDAAGATVSVGIHLLEGVKAGDFVLVHSGFALQVISREEAAIQLELIRAMKSSNRDGTH